MEKKFSVICLSLYEFRYLDSVQVIQSWLWEKKPIYYSLPMLLSEMVFFSLSTLLKSLSSPKINEVINWELFGLTQGFFVSFARNLLCVTFLKFISFVLIRYFSCLE